MQAEHSAPVAANATACLVSRRAVRLCLDSRQEIADGGGGMSGEAGSVPCLPYIMCLLGRRRFMRAASIRLLALCLGLAAVLPALAPDRAISQSRDRQDRRMVIVNESGRVIREFYATNTGVNKWGRDLLGDKVIPPGQRFAFNFDDGTGYCMFDFRAVLDNGRPVERYRVNVCEYVAWTVR
jgi:hypothetical protein